MAVRCMKNRIYKIALFEHIVPLSTQNNIVSKSFLHDQNNFGLKFKRRKLSNKVQTMLHPQLLSVAFMNQMQSTNWIYEFLPFPL